jgi:hypothetical protein
MPLKLVKAFFGLDFETGVKFVYFNLAVETGKPHFVMTSS